MRPAEIRPVAKSTMSTKQSDDERQVTQSDTEKEQMGAMDDGRNWDHYVKHHGYQPDDFAESGEVTNFNGIRVLEASGGDKSESFEGFRDLKASGWSINYESAERLNDGTILYEGRL